MSVALLYVAFWEQPTEGAQWRHRVQSDGKFYLNGTQTESFDTAAIYDAAYAVAAEGRVSQVLLKPRKLFREIVR